MASQGELQRRHQGHDPQKMVTMEELRTGFMAADSIRLRKAVRDALEQGFQRDVPDSDTADEVNLVLLAACGLLGALVTELGDLVFSFIKREYGVKDYGHLLPGHGGMMDRFDSMVLCGPVVLFVLMYLFGANCVFVFSKNLKRTI